MWTLNDRAAKLPLADYPVSAGHVISTAFDDAIDNNPVPLFMQAMELNRLRDQGAKLPKDQAEAEAKRNGVTVKVPKEGMTPAALSFMIQRRKDEADKQMVFARSPGGFAATGGQFAAGMAGAMLDPVNMAAGFIPVLGGTRYAAALGQAGAVGARAGLRAGVGAVEGVVGAALVEAPTLALRRDLQDDYTMVDSLANIAFGTFASAGLRTGAGALRDFHLGLDKARQLDAMRSIEPEVWERMRQQTANAEERTFFSDLEGGFARGEGIPDQMQTAFEGQRARADFEAESRGAQSEFGDAMGEYVAERQAVHTRITAEADAAIERRMLRERDKALAAGMEPDEALREAFRVAMPEVDKRLKSQAEIGAERAGEAELTFARQALARNQGLIFVPSTAREIEASISTDTHVQALRASVAQAIDGRRVDPTAVVRTDPVFRNQRLSEQEVKLMAQSDQAPENKVAADKGASERAAVDVGAVEKHLAEGDDAALELSELRKLTTEAERSLTPEAKEKLDAKDDRTTFYEKAWNAVADCLEGKA